MELLNSGFDIGLHDYPIFDESYRNVLNRKLIDRYLLNEIGAGTPQAFKHYLNNAMDMIMPYYNKLYESEKIEFDPLNNIDITETFEQKTNSNVNVNGTNTTNETGETKGNSSDTSKVTTSDNGTSTNIETTTNNETSLNVKSDTPNSKLTLDEILSDHYASDTNRGESEVLGSRNNTNTVTHTADNLTTNTSSNKITNTLNNTNSVNSNTNAGETQNWTRTEKGSSAGLPFSKAIQMLRETFLNIDKEIIDNEEIKSCFYLVYDFD